MIGPRAAVAAAVTLLAIGCGDEPGEAPRPGIRDADPERVVSLIPAATQMIVALGADERLVARTDYDHQDVLADLPSIGQGLTPSLESLTVLRPELVVAWPDNTSRSVIQRLRELGISVYSPEIQTLDDIWRTIEGLGVRLDLEDRADSLTRAIRSELERIESAVTGLERPSVLYLVWYDPPTTTARGTFIHELIELAGGRNIFSGAPGRWPQVSIEEIVRRDPDILLVPRGADSPIDLEVLEEATGWRRLAAIREGRVVPLDAELFNRPGPNVTEAAERLAEILHPEAFR